MELAATPHLEFFQWSICSSCPRGFVIDNKLDANFPCLACSVSEGVASPVDATWRECVQCSDHHYQLADSVTYEHNCLKTTEVGVLCTLCHPGRQRTVERACRRAWGIADICCSPCPVNKYKARNEGECQPTLVSQVAVIQSLSSSVANKQYVTSGATAAELCTGGDMLFYCNEYFCTNKQHEATPTEDTVRPLMVY